MMKYITWGSLLLTFCIGYGQPTTMQSKDSATFRDHLGDLTLTRANVELIFEFDTLPGNAGFWTIYHHRDSVDKIMGAEGSATNYLDNAISKYSEQKVSFTLTGKNSKSTWRKMYRIIKKEFGREFAERISIKERILFYSKRHDTGNIVKYFTAFIGRYPLDTSAYEKVRFNNNVWRLYFLYSADPSALSLAIKKMRTLLDTTDKNRRLSAIFIDTYANLLYKKGDREDAILWEKKAMALQFKNRNYQIAYEKMLRNEKTWP